MLQTATVHPATLALLKKRNAMEQPMTARQIRIAELIENLGKLTQLIDLHKRATRSVSMIKQYEFKRGEFVAELQGCSSL